MTGDKYSGLLTLRPMTWEALKENDFYANKVNVKDIVLAYNMNAVEQKEDKHLMYLSIGIRKSAKDKDIKGLRRLLTTYQNRAEKNRYANLKHFKPEAALYPMLKIIMSAAMIDNDVEEVYNSKIKNVEPHLGFVQREYFNKNNHDVNAGMMTEEQKEYVDELQKDKNLKINYVEYTEPSGILYVAVHSKDYTTIDMMTHYANEQGLDTENFLLALAMDADYARDWADLIRKYGVIPPGQTYTKLAEYFNKKRVERKTKNR